MARIGGLGVRAKDGAYLLLDNFRKKIERVGIWRKDASVTRWVRLPTGPDVCDVLEGVGDINISETPEEP